MKCLQKLKMIIRRLKPKRVVLPHAVIEIRLAGLPNFSRDKWFILDGMFVTTDIETFKQYINEFTRKGIKYLSEIFDCDDFSLYFKAWLALRKRINAVAIVIDYSGGHAYNIIFPYDYPTVIVEPQTGEIIEIKNRRCPPYCLKDYIILI